MGNTSDLEGLREIELQAGRSFHDVDMSAIANDEPIAVETLAAYREAGRLWVSEVAGEVQAYLIADLVDGNAHIEQVSVHPDAAGQGLGRRLIEHACHWARENALTSITLTTFRDVPWNMPYYQRLGFSVLGDAEIGSELKALRAQERTGGLDQWPRVCMYLAVGVDE